MTITYTAYTDEELEKIREDAQKILDPGIYDFEVYSAEETESKSGNPMVVLDMYVWDKEGSKYSVRDYLVIMDSMLFKIKHFWESVGRAELYGQPHEADDFVGMGGKLETTIQEQTVEKKDGSGKEKRKYLRVKDYVSTIKVGHDDLDDDITF